MGYVKIVQYGDITEVYEYQNDLRTKQGIDALKATRLSQSGKSDGSKRIVSVRQKRQKQLRIQLLQKGWYERSKASIKRSRQAFLRLCHHNNCNAKSIHFLTLTFADEITVEKAQRNVKRFMERVAKVTTGAYPRYISVPEFTKKGRIHYHLLVYDLPPETAKKERATRNFQRQFRAGYVDLRLATYNSLGIAAYMAKYMAKALGNEQYTTIRGYTCSRNIKKITTAGSNLITHYSDLIVPTQNIAIEKTMQYNVPYMGTCTFKKIKSLSL